MVIVPSGALTTRRRDVGLPRRSTPIWRSKSCSKMWPRRRRVFGLTVPCRRASSIIERSCGTVVPNANIPPRRGLLDTKCRWTMCSAPPSVSRPVRRISVPLMMAARRLIALRTRCPALARARPTRPSISPLAILPPPVKPGMANPTTFPPNEAYWPAETASPLAIELPMSYRSWAMSGTSTSASGRRPSGSSYLYGLFIA